MVKQHPHRLVISIVGTSTQDGNGNWQPGTPSTKEVACRAEPNSRNAIVQVVDGTQVVYQYTIYMGKGVDAIPIGVNVTLYNGDEVLCNNTVKMFSRGQLNARLWL